MTIIIIRFKNNISKRTYTVMIGAEGGAEEMSWSLEAEGQEDKT